MFFAPLPTLTRDTSPSSAHQLADSLVSLFYNSQVKSIAPMLSFLNFRFVLLSNSAVPNFGADAHFWNYSVVYSSLKKAADLKLIFENSYISLWENEEHIPGVVYLSSHPVIEPQLPVILSGYWSSSNNSLASTGEGILLSDQLLHDFDFTARIHLTSNKSYNAGLLFGFTNISNYYFTGLFGKSYLVPLAQISHGITYGINKSQSGYTSPIFIHISLRASNLSVFYSPDGVAWQSKGNYSLGDYDGGYVGLWAPGPAEFSGINLRNSTGDRLLSGTALTLADVISTPGFLASDPVLVSHNSTRLISNISPFPVLQPPHATINQIHYSTYNIEASNSSRYVIVLNQNYDPDWRLYDGRINWFEALLMIPSSSCSHFQANHFANAWVCTNNDAHDYTLHYIPQSYFLLGSSVTILFAAILLIYVSYQSLVKLWIAAPENSVRN